MEMESLPYSCLRFAMEVLLVLENGENRPKSVKRLPFIIIPFSGGCQGFAAPAALGSGLPVQADDGEVFPRAAGPGPPQSAFSGPAAGRSCHRAPPGQRPSWSAWPPGPGGKSWTDSRGLTAATTPSTALAHGVPLRVVLHHRVVVDHQVDVERLQHLALDLVDEVVAGQGVLLGAHLHMDRGEALAGAVVVDQQVVEAQDLFVGRGSGR